MKDKSPHPIIDDTPDNRLVRLGRKLHVLEFAFHGEGDLLQPIEELILPTAIRT